MSPSLLLSSSIPKIAAVDHIQKELVIISKEGDERMNAKQLFLTLVLVSFLSQPFWTLAEDKKMNVYTLEEAIKEGLENNETIKAKEEKIEQAKYAKKQARSEFLPKLSTSYGYTRLSETNTFRSSLPTGPQEIAVSSKDNYQWKGSLTQPLFTGFALISSYKLAELGIDQSDMELELEKLDLALRVKEAYFNILIADANVDVAERDVEFRQSNLKVARSFYDVGMVPINDVLRAEVELGNAEQNMVTAKNAARLARSNFNTVLSKPVNEPVDVETPEKLYEPERGEFSDYEKRAFENRPEMKLIEIGLNQLEQQKRLAKSKIYPEVAMQYDYIKEGDEWDIDGSPFHDAGRWQASVGLTWTFWEWGKTHYSVKEEESRIKELLRTKKALEYNISLELKDAVLRLKNAEENIPVTEKAVKSGEENLRVNEERYKAQVTTITEVLDAQSLLTRARVNYLTALYNHNLAKAKLMRALGKY
jgi:outer membrane protein TolC